MFPAFKYFLEFTGISLYFVRSDCSFFKSLVQQDIKQVNCTWIFCDSIFNQFCRNLIQPGQSLSIIKPFFNFKGSKLRHNDRVRCKSR